jgi:aryl-alcohol dehydrogenase-like predicted oxidoreductase
MKVCLGTAQFGLDYGINNPNGKISKESIPEILNFAHDSGVFMLDTASAYGNSELVLGESVNKTGKEFKIITKYPIDKKISPYNWIDTSLNLLKIEKAYGYLFHSYSIFDKKPEYIEDFVKIKQDGKSEKIGFSLYYPYEAEYILKNNIPCDIVQIPYNIFDQRFAYLFSDFNNAGIDIYVRSVFLQGLFFFFFSCLDAYFDSVKQLLIDLHQAAKYYSINIASLCLSFINLFKDINYVVIGIDSLDDLKENINNYNSLNSIDIPNSFFRDFSVNDENIILPFNWQK